MTWQGQISAFLAAHNTLTLATVDDRGLPYAAALFYAEDTDLNIYFLSEKKSAHSRHIAISPWVAATIQDDSQLWQEIQGLQLHGRAELLTGTARLAAITIYVQKHPFLKPMLRGKQCLAALSQVVSNASFYRLQPCWLRLIDNRKGFAHKESWKLPCGEENRFDDHED